MGTRADPVLSWRRRWQQSAAAGLALLLTFVIAVATPAAAAADGVAPRLASGGASLPAMPEGVTRLAGDDRYGTAVAVSQAFAPGVAVVYVATGADYPDALSAAAVAARDGGPLLLTRRHVLPAAVAAEIARLAPARIVVVGGTGVVDAGVERQLGAIAPTSRVSGRDRYETSARLVASAFPAGAAPDVLLATGRTFPDALAASGAAGAAGMPVLLVNGAAQALPSDVLSELARLGARGISVAGGYGAVSAGIQAQLQRAGFVVQRHAGASRYETAAAINEAFFAPGDAGLVVMATGADFPDALAGAALAGVRGAPLHIVRPSCVPQAPLSAMTVFGAPARVVLGGVGAISESAAALTGCSAPDAGPVDHVFRATGFTLDPAAPVPYADRAPVDVHDAAQTVDATGLRTYHRRGDRALADHPVAMAQYGISALAEFERTGDATWKQRAVRQAERLIEMRTLRGDAWWFAYSFDWAYGERTLRAPWWSAMAQGQALSLFVRLATETGDQRWHVAADRTWKSFLQPRAAQEPWAVLVQDGALFLEEYAGGQPPLLVLNGQIFALFGIHDYWRMTGDAQAARMFDGGATTVLEVMPEVRVPGGVSYYCVDTPFCQRPLWQNAKYHVIHSWQLDSLESLTGDERFGTWAQTLRDDWAPATMRRSVPDVLDADPLEPATW
ncbi:hypothetical protein E4V99_01555 [Microbacterium sp. dk485]|uniref:cell wall-binding repeat-containing protein n=1 Tax=Microbacterium sp. dk485 TaxID=2560021 RepID=UPI00107454F0|nr:cell wall-binding repeat-containing protein [Microbacterium sp. dk485]TFV83802.1 hypothetical protein E4V99_01555 [Microbacterium sp. dk485]